MSSGTYDKYITMAASAVAAAVVVRGVVSELLPYEARDMLHAAARYLRARLSPRHTVIIDENEGLSANQIYDAARAYLAARISTDVPRLRASRVDEAQAIAVGMEPGEAMVDVHDGVHYTWRLVVNRDGAGAGGGSAVDKPRGRLDTRAFEVSFHRRHRDKAIATYLPHVVATAKSIRDQHRSLKMHMIEYDAWTAVDLRHPSTFDTIAMATKLKQSVMDDLERFVRRKDYYRRIGRAWKRGYLLYGPPGTGKSSLVAAMANHLKFDIYDLELTEVKSNSDLRRLLVGMSNRSILVIEDIDCTIDLQQREEGDKRTSRSGFAGEENDDKVTLSGLLNFVDGLWSQAGRRGSSSSPPITGSGLTQRYCGLAGWTCTSTWGTAPQSRSGSSHTTAEVAEVLMRNENSDVVLQDLLDFLKAKRKEAGASKL